MKKSELRQMIKEELQNVLTKKSSLKEGMREDLMAQRKLFSDFESKKTRRPSAMKEGMSKYNSNKALSYFRNEVDDVLVLVQDIKRWLAETALEGGIDLADDLLKDLKKEIAKISPNDY